VGYVVAGYAVTLAALGGYAWRTLRRSRNLAGPRPGRR
jgi:hypothetical protein